MTPAKIILGSLLCIGALFGGTTIGLALAGFGICAVSFSLGLLAAAVAVGIVFAGAIALLWPKLRWAGALAFSAPMLLGLAYAASNPERQRLVGIIVCMLGTIGAAVLVRYPGRRRPNL